MYACTLNDNNLHYKLDLIMRISNVSNLLLFRIKLCENIELYDCDNGV